MAGGAALPKMPVARLAFVPKGEEAGDAQEVVRTGMALRPLAQQNVDGKIEATARAFEPEFQASATPEHRGFIPGRLLVNTVVELDLEGLKLSIVADAGSFLFFRLRGVIPLASPHLHHMVLEEEGLPEGFLHVVRAMYAENQVVWAAAGREFEIARVTSGVLQGSPLSSLLCVATMDPIKRALVRAAPPCSCVRVMADDVGAAVPEVRSPAACGGFPTRRAWPPG